MAEEVKREELPWGQLGDHFPTVIDALVFTECKFEECGHGMDDTECPTHQEIVCGGEACFMHPEIGEIAAMPEWPCGPLKETQR